MLIIKVGGGESINLRGIAADLAQLQEQVIVVHGANALRDRLASALGRPKTVLTSVSGYSSVYSDDTALELLMMAYAGLRNKRFVELCQQHGINAVGLTGLDGRSIQGRRNRGIRVRENGRLRIVRDLSGKPQRVNAGLLRMLLEHGYTPVLTVPIVDENGYAINSENDDVVAVLQAEFQAGMVLQLIEAPGLLRDRNDPNTLIPRLPREALGRQEQHVSGRMKRKILALRRLFEHGVQTVVISDGRVEHPIRDALNGKGTVIQ